MVIEPDCTATVTAEGNIRIDVRALNRKPVGCINNTADRYPARNVG